MLDAGIAGLGRGGCAPPVPCGDGFAARPGPWLAGRAALPPQPGAGPGPEDSREGRTWRARRGSRARLRWPVQRRGRWCPWPVRRRPWLCTVQTAPVRPPRRPVQHGAPLPLLALSGLVSGRSRALLVPPWLRQTTPQPGRGKARARPTLEDLNRPPSPLRGARRACGPLSKPSLALAPGAALVAAAGRLPPPVAKLRSCVASLRSLRRRPPPPLLTPRPRLAVPLPAGIQSLGGSAGGIARPASLSRECRPWRAGVLPGVPPAPSMAPGRGLRFKRTSHLDRSVGWRVRLRWPLRAHGLRPSAPGLAGQHGAPGGPG